ncbi:MAG: ATP-binding protein [Candidatus Nanohaloarchaea archaeon]
MEFINRERELDFLAEKYSSEQAELIVLYGRRRIGKSELVRKSLESIENSVYYQATESTPTNQLEKFEETGKRKFPELEKLENDWEILLEHLGNENAVVAIDEFPFLIEADGSVLSKFQRVWDQHLQNTGMTLILIGSSISVMEEKVLSGGSPLYGRRTGSIDLEPLEIEQMLEFYEAEPGQAIRAYSVFGGTPHYLQSLQEDKNLRENIEELILHQEGRLHDEPEFLLRTELEKPARYFSILGALASGKTTQNEIAQETGIDHSQIGSYLSKLRKIRLVEREVPVTEDPKHTRRSIYRISEPLFRFWFRFLYGRQDRLELAENPYRELIEPELNDFISPAFEELCQTKVPELIPAKYTRTGRWWYQEHEIDVVGIAEEKTVLGEAKYTNQKAGKPLLDHLEKKREKIRLPKESKENVEFALFSRKGFTQDFLDLGNERSDIYLFTPRDLF